MNQRHGIVRLTGLILAILSLTAGLCPASERRPILLGSAAAPKDIPAERFYVAVPDGDDDRLIEIFHKLDAAGARKIHVFLPDLIVCEAPVSVEPRALVAGPGVVVASASEAHQQLSRLNLRVKPATIERAYTEIKLRRQKELAGEERSVPEQQFTTTTRPIPLEAMYRSARRAERINMMSAAGADAATTADARLIHQNSELLIGNILINIVLPDSDYPGWWWLDWSPESIDQVHLGFFFAMEDFMDEFPNADIGVIYKYHDQVPISAEPIRYSPSNDEHWITMCMRKLGYPGTEAESVNSVHQFNDDSRRRSGTDWAFTAFIALAVGNWYGPYFYGAREVSWSYIGGPYFVTSYPAGSLWNAWGMCQIASHEIGHIFWALEEDAGPASSCADHSGYLDVPNGNKVTKYDPYWGGRSGCGLGTPIPCTMNQLDQVVVAFDPGACTYTKQMWGVADLNENAVPDALDRGPVIEFFAAEIETVVTPVDHFDVRVRSLPIPNLNPRQPDDLRRDYAARIRDIDVAVGGLLPYTIEPSEVDSDGYEAEFRIDLPPFIPGRLEIDVGARNAYYAKSPTRTKQYRYVHLKYLGFEVEHPNEGIRLSWTMLGELFDARFTLHRRNEDTGDEVVIAEGFAPTGPTDSGITPFEVLDDDTDPGTEYTYWVSGTIDLPNSAGVIHKEVASKPVVVQGAVARVRTPSSLISNVAPNPFSQRTWLSMDIPHPDPRAPTDGSTAADDAVLPVKVTVYDIRGRRVSEIFNRNVIDDVLTISWDGTDDRGRSMPSGVYFMRINVAGTTENRKVMLIR